jgi:hypothetical protein
VNIAEAPRTQESPEEAQKRLLIELKTYAADATIGSPKLLAINDRWKHGFKRREIASLNIQLARVARREESQDKREALSALSRYLTVKELISEQIERDIDEREVSLPGYYEASERLTNITRALHRTYTSIGDGKDADFHVTTNLFELRQNGIQRGPGGASKIK